jgi:hypothetical protein
MDDNGESRIRCRWCEKLSFSRSGILKHEKNAHLREFLNPSSSSSQASSSEEDLDCESIFSAQISNDSFQDNFLDAEPDTDDVGLSYLDSTTINNGECDHFYFDAQLEAASKGKRSNDLLSRKRSVLLLFSGLVSQLELSNEKIDLLLGFIHSQHLLFNELPRAWATYERELNRYIGEGTFEGNATYGDGEVKVPFDIGDVNKLAPTVHIVKRSNALTALVKVVLDSNLCQAGNMNFLPTQLLTTDGERAYGDPWTGNWWERLCSNYVAPGCVPLVLKLFTDGTICGKTKSRTPMMASVVNMRRSVQRSSFGKTYLAFAPQVRVHKVSQAKAADMRYRVKQELYNLILQDIRPLSSSRFSLMIQGQVRQMQVA